MISKLLILKWRTESLEEELHQQRRESHVFFGINHMEENETEDVEPQLCQIEQN